MVFNRTHMPIHKGNARTLTCALKHCVRAQASSTTNKRSLMSPDRTRCRAIAEDFLAEC
jgi:hypothetical protein